MEDEIKYKVLNDEDGWFRFKKGEIILLTNDDIHTIKEFIKINSNKLKDFNYYLIPLKEHREKINKLLNG